ncbi:DUF3953 domain-containing protein [Bacillus gobiensis]|uniref:DUF3953 domain-containing protein n=1 Tax=Bacillus gobiensis TaxID=1441095 RepID=UPI003D22A0BF
MLKIFRILIAVIVIILSGFSLLTDYTGILPIMNFFLGLMLLVMGIEEIKANKKRLGYILIISSGVIFIVCTLEMIDF